MVRPEVHFYFMAEPFDCIQYALMGYCTIEPGGDIAWINADDFQKVTLNITCSTHASYGGPLKVVKIRTV